MAVLFAGGCRQEVQDSSKPEASIGNKATGHPELSSEHVDLKASVQKKPVLLHDSVLPLLVEAQAQALPIWREYREEKPVLMVFSSKVVRPVPDQLRDEVDRLLSAGRGLEIVRRTARPVADRLLDADMGVAAAISQGWFSRVVWVVPLGEGEVMRPLIDFKAMLRERASGWGDSIDSFWELEEGGFSGELDGVPIDVLPAQLSPNIDGPLLVHFDAGYFGAMYRNEVKTPLLELMQGALGHVAGRGYAPLAVTVSRDTQNYELPLTLRFLAKSIAEVLAEPERLHESSERMQLRSEIQYLERFFQPQTIAEKAQALIRTDPGDADAFYAYYLALRQAKQLDRALAVLEQVLALDPGYADTYIELVNHAAQKSQWEAALAMIERAQTALSDNPLVTLREAQLLVEMGRGEEAVAIIDELSQLPWSEVYYPRIRGDMTGLLQKVRKQD